MNSPQEKGIQYISMQANRTAQSKKKNQQNPAGGKKINKRKDGGLRQKKINAVGGTFPPIQSNQLAAAYAVGQKSNPPRVVSSGTQTRIIHRELIAKVVMTTNFAAQRIAVNPGLQASFPWLSSQAVAWETYRFNSLRYRYYTRTGSNSAGSVILSPDYDASDATPTSEIQTSENAGTVEDAVWKDITCHLRPEGMHALGPKKFTRQGTLPANQDIKTYDAASLFICTVDGTPGPAGVVWVEYDVTLSNPQVPPGGFGALYMRLATSAPTSGNPLSANPTASGPSVYGTMSGQVFTFTSSGRFTMDYFCQAATSVTMAASTVAGGGVVVDYGNPAGSATTRMEDVLVLDAIVGTTVTYPVTIVGGTVADLFVTPLAVFAPF
jgi:hypothetical protein